MSLHPPMLAFDKSQAERKRDWRTARGAERRFAARLRQAAVHIGQIVKGFDLSTFEGDLFARVALEKYGQALEPWAEAVVKAMHAEVDARNRAAWRESASLMGKSLAKEVTGTPQGKLMRKLMQEQVHLISSLPRDAAQRVHDWTMKGIQEGTRPEVIKEQILRTGEVTESRARLIARTEVARTASKLTEARSVVAGSTQYIWRTMRDQGVRQSHKEMEGKVCDWAKPPTLSDGTTTHAGQIYNCRCYAEPIFPDDLAQDSRFRLRLRPVAR